MYAFRGDVVIVHDDACTPAGRRAEVLSGDHTDGRPPYWVRWSDSGHEGLLFPRALDAIVHAGPTYEAEYDLGAVGPSDPTV